MNISGISSTASLPSMLGDNKSQQVGLELSVAIMKQVMNSEQQMAQAIIEMIQQPVPSPSGTGQIIDRSA